jgi:hypothetical protein
LLHFFQLLRQRLLLMLLPLAGRPAVDNAFQLAFLASCAFCSAATWLDSPRWFVLAMPAVCQAIQADASGEAMAIASAQARLVLLPPFFFRYSLAVACSTASPGLFNHGGLILLFRHYGFQC